MIGRALAVVTVVLVAGCGTASGNPQRAANDIASANQSPTSAQRPAGAFGRLLAAERLPGFGTATAWTVERSTKSEGARLAGTCHRFALTSIGAMKVVRRTFVPTSEDASGAASESVATFPDAKTAKRAYAVLSSWREQCADQVETGVTVGDLQPLSLRRATGGWYLLSAEGTVDAQGFVRKGARLAVLTITGDEPATTGKNPMAVGLKRAAALL